MPGPLAPVVAGLGWLGSKALPWAGRVLFGAKPLLTSAEKYSIAFNRGLAGQTIGSAITRETIKRGLGRAGSRIATAGSAAVLAGEALEHLGGGASGSWGPPPPPQAPGGFIGGPMPSYPMIPAGPQQPPMMPGPGQMMGRGYRWPMVQPLRGYRRWVDPFGTVYWRRKRRRMNVLNPRALRRAHTRVQGFEKFVMRNFSITRRAKVKPKKRRR